MIIIVLAITGITVIDARNYYRESLERLAIRLRLHLKRIDVNTPATAPAFRPHNVFR